jgi:Protein of unknown function (DUF3987)
MAKTQDHHQGYVGNQPTVADGIHELGHVARLLLFDKSIPQDMREGITDADIDAAMKWSGVVNGNWTTEAEETFANGLLKHIKGGKFPSKGLKSVFEKVVGWLKKIYKSINQKTDADQLASLEISPAMQEVYDKLISRGRKDSQLSWEAIPSKTMDIIPEIHNASYAIKKEYLKRISDVLFKNGDWIAKAVGLDVPVTITGFSAWKGDIGAGAQSKFEVMLENNGGVKTITKEDRKKLDLYANILGYVLSQDGVYWHVPVYANDPALENGFEITGSRSWSGSEFKDLYDAIRNEFGQNTDLAPAFMTNGARILNFSMDNTDFQSRMIKVVNAIHGSNPDFLGSGVKMKSFRSEGNEYNATSNDWRENPNGEAYTSRISQAGRPNLQRRSDNVRQAVISATRKFAKEQGWNTKFTAAPITDSGRRYSPGRRSESTGDSDGRGRSSGGRYSPLKGAPSKQGATGPDPRLVDVAEQYARDNGIDLKRQAEYVQIDEARAKRIAQAYEDMSHAPDDPAVREAYADLIRQTKAQYDALVAAGYTFTFYDGASDPYAGNPVNAMRDLRQNQTMAVYGTYDGYGTEGITKGAVDDNPMLIDTGLLWKDQNGADRPVTANDLFRAVHDAFGHGLEGASFRARGEENAWQAHVRLFSLFYATLPANQFGPVHFRTIREWWIKTPIEFKRGGRPNSKDDKPPNLRIKRTWQVPPIIWSCVVAPSGSAKSVPPKQALRPIYARQAKLIKQFDKDFEEYQRAHEVYLKELAEFKKSKDEDELPPTPPLEPVCPRIVVNDTTIEALAKRLSANPRGVLALYDELAGWLGAFNRYSKGSGDEARWLEFYNAQTSIIDRASSQRPLVVPRANVSLFGTIQPGILRKHLTEEYKASGLAARLLFAMPPRERKQWSEYEVDERIENQVADIFDKLLLLEMQVTDDDELRPTLVNLDHNAKQLFINYFNRHNREQQALDEDLYAAFAKLEEVAARFALVVHAVRYAIGEVPSIATCDLVSMSAGIELCEWFKHEAKRVYAVLAENALAHENRQLLQWITSQDGPVSARDFHRGCKGKLASSDEAERMLQSFVDAELGRWVDGLPNEHGGRPTRRFELKASDETSTIPGNQGGYGTDSDETPTEYQEWRA